MRIILFSALLLMLYSCGGSQKSYNQSYTPQPSFENLAKKYSDKELCERAYNVKAASSYSKSLTKEIKIRSLNCNSIFEAIAKKEREIEEKRIARLEEDHGFYCHGGGAALLDASSCQLHIYRHVIFKDTKLMPIFVNMPTGHLFIRLPQLIKHGNPLRRINDYGIRLF